MSTKIFIKATLAVTVSLLTVFVVSCAQQQEQKVMDKKGQDSVSEPTAENGTLGTRAWSKGRTVSL